MLVWRNSTSLPVVQQSGVRFPDTKYLIFFRIYRKLASQMGFDSHHFHLRPMSFETAQQRKSVDPHPTTMTTFVVLDVMADKYVVVVVTATAAISSSRKDPLNPYSRWIKSFSVITLPPRYFYCLASGMRF